MAASNKQTSTSGITMFSQKKSCSLSSDEGMKIRGTCLPCRDGQRQGKRARRGQLTADEVERIGQSLLARLHHAHDS
ncbi:hypothetical protein RBWH47_04174 [Rhodopirellula baltica WH47]|uniref:Uncharacterized protein n=1 Tax=Rhodopirellula baltica WH47 TaxID=991778 RepID=F2ANP9_RHOBT|nr:hypothetical protein RBWH47_04174 [Rhodopirellula baltica WH47]